jgi:hypothetical protein
VIVRLIAAGRPAPEKPAAGDALRDPRDSNTLSGTGLQAYTRSCVIKYDLVTLRRRHLDQRPAGDGRGAIATAAIGDLTKLFSSCLEWYPAGEL